MAYKTQQTQSKYFLLFPLEMVCCMYKLLSYDLGLQEEIVCHLLIV